MYIDKDMSIGNLFFNALLNEQSNVISHYLYVGCDPNWVATEGCPLEIALTRK